MKEEEREKAFLEFLDAHTKGSYGVCKPYGPPFEAPWVVFPNIKSQYGIGWRMGGGEDFMVQFQTWYKSASKGERRDFQSKWPEPSGFETFYENLDKWHPVDE